MEYFPLFGDDAAINVIPSTQIVGSSTSPSSALRNEEGFDIVDHPNSSSRDERSRQGHTDIDNTNNSVGGDRPRLIINEIREEIKANDQTHLYNGKEVTMYLNASYIRTCSGFLRVTQIVLTAVSLGVLATSKGSNLQSYLLLPNHLYYRLYIFVLVFGMMSSSALLFVYTCDITQNIPYNWPLVDFVLHAIIAAAFFFTSTLLAATHDFRRLHTDSSTALDAHLLTVIILGYLTTIIYALTSAHGFRRWRLVVPYRFQQQAWLEDLHQAEEA